MKPAKLPVLVLLSFVIGSAIAAPIALYRRQTADRNPITLETPIERDTVYGIRGTTASDLRAEMRRKGVKDEYGTFNAYARWHVNWTYTTTLGSAGCRVSSAKVIPTVDYTYPHWEDEANGAIPLKAEWARYSKALRLHEHGHGTIGIAAASGIRTMLSTATAPNCQNLETDIRSKTDAIIREHQAKDRSYDAVTNHGVLQGTTLIGE